jgi:hypothetical protein
MEDEDTDKGVEAFAMAVTIASNYGWLRRVILLDS